MTTISADAPCLAASTSPSPFVINLCSSTSPMALAHPDSPELKRYTFFVSRQREDGRERFRLHMGYFDSQDAAEQLLAAVREVYPAAWAGPAPAHGAARRSKSATPRLAAVTTPVAPAPAPAPAPASAPAPAAPAQEVDALEQTMSEMRSVLAQLDEEGPAQMAPQPLPQVAPPPAPAIVPKDLPRLQPVTRPKAAATKTPAPAPELTPAQTLNILEAPAPSAKPAEVRSEANASLCYAVQLVCSATPVEATTLPRLAIFNAYTLYNVEGSRQGHNWYGVRLGFFSDRNSAAQVANYVRSDYSSVAVVPVAPMEKDHVRGGGPPTPADSGINPPLKPKEQLSIDHEAMAGFELVADDRPLPEKRDLAAAGQSPAVTRAAVRAKLDKLLNPVPAGGAPQQAAGKRVTVRRKKPDATVQGAPGTAAVLESTLELLGASTLTLDESKGKVIDPAVARRASAGGKPSNGRLSRLFSRLGGG